MCVVGTGNEKTCFDQFKKLYMPRRKEQKIKKINKWIHQQRWRNNIVCSSRISRDEWRREWRTRTNKWLKSRNWGQVAELRWLRKD